MKPVTITPDSNHATVDSWWGFSVKEDSGSAATVEFRKAAVDGTVVWYLNLAAGESASIMFPSAVAMEGGVYVNELTGSVSGILFAG